MAYPDTDALKAYIAIDDSITADDGLLDLCLEDAIAYLEGETGRRFEVTEDTTRYYDCIAAEAGGPLDGLSLILDGDLAQLTSVVNGDGATITSGSYHLKPYNTTPAHTISLDGTTGEAWAFSSTPYRCIQVTGRWGYSLTAPDDVRRAALEMAAALYRKRSAPGLDQDRAILADGYVIQPADIPVYAKRVIGRYRRPST